MAGFFKEMGAGVVNADHLVHEVYQKGNQLERRLRSLFPELQGKLSRAAIASIVFRDPRRRRSLESLTHPYVLRRIKEEVGKQKQGVVIVEVPLLFERGLHRHYDLTIAVKAPAAKALRRLLRKGYGRGDVRYRWRAQMPEGKKIGLADYVVDNSDGLEETRRQVIQIWNLLKGKKGAW